ncbi:MAG TPA: PadR family transcriptional regulator [Pseudonocardiaceae bacterium]|nr:PadR family transcriptional regulator [Pseudonocardiaceae bacterium]
MWIDILLLSSLAKQPSHGYELRRRVEEVTGHALSNNSLYPTLRRFHDAGAVTRTAQSQPGTPPRHVYAITDVGREMLHDMLAELPEELAGESAEFLARLGSFRLLTGPERMRVLDARDRALTRQRDRLAGFGSGVDYWSGEVLAEVQRQLLAERDWIGTLRAVAEKPLLEEEVDDRRG